MANTVEYKYRNRIKLKETQGQFLKQVSFPPFEMKRMKFVIHGH